MFHKFWFKSSKIQKDEPAIKNFENIDSQQSASLSADTAAPESSALFDAITNNGSKISATPTNTTTLKLHTFQLVSSPNSLAKTTQSLTPSKAPVIQRMQTVNPFANSQPITKTIVNASSSTSQSIGSFKVLNQQQQQIAPFNIKPLGSMNSKTSTLQNNSHTSIQFPLSKSLASNNTELSGKPVITTVKSDVNQITTCLKKNVSVGFCEYL